MALRGRDRIINSLIQLYGKKGEAQAVRVAREKIMNYEL